MRRLTWIAMPIVAAAALGAAGTLYAATSPKALPLPFGTAFWTAVANKVGVSATKLETAVEAEMKAHGGAFRHGGYRGYGVPPGINGSAGGAADATAIGQFVFQTAARYIGVTPAALTADVAKGQSINSVAASHHKSAAGLDAAENKALLQVLKAK